MDSNSKKKCGCKIKEVWIVPKKEERSSWDTDYISKEMFVEALHLTLVGEPEEDLDDIHGENITETNEDMEEMSDDKSDKEPEHAESDADMAQRYETQANANDNNENEETYKTINSQPVFCLKCPKQFNDKKSLKSHVYETHSEPKACSLCPKTFHRPSMFRRHMREVHRKRQEDPMCANCGKTFSGKQYLKKHELKCLGENVTKDEFSCQYCDKLFSSKQAKSYHEKKKHRIEKNGGYIIVNNPVTVKQQEPGEKLYKVCNIPQKFSTKRKLKKHMIRMHDGKNDVIKWGKIKRYLSEEEVRSQESKQVACEYCAENFSCQQNQEEHLKTVHGVECFFKCNICPKSFRKRKSLKDHLSKVHRTPSIICTECGKKSKMMQEHKTHMETHNERAGRGRPKTPMSTLKRSQQYARTKQEANDIKKKLFETPEIGKKSMIDSIMKDYPTYYNKIKESPMIEAEVIQLINDNNLVDAQILNICQFMRQKWGNKVITPNIKKQLIKRKSLLDPFFTLVTLDSSTELHFKTKKGKILSRSVVYCHDIPGLIAFKKLIENVDKTKITT